MRELFKRDNHAFLLFTGGFYFGWLSLVARSELLFVGSHNLFQGASFLCLIAVCFIVIRNFKGRVPIFSNTWFKIIGFTVILIQMGVLGLPLFSLAPGRFLGTFVQETTVFLYIFAGLSFCFFKPIQRDLFCLSFLPIIALSYYLIAFVDIKYVAAVADRKDAFVQTGVWMRYTIVWGTGATSAPIFLLSLLNPNKRWISAFLSSGLVLWLYASLVYGKRQGLLEFVFFLSFLTLLFLFNKEVRKNAWILVCGGVVLIITGVILFLSDTNLQILATRVVDRFMAIRYGGLESFDRLQEAQYVLGNASLIQLIFGQGLLSFNLDTPGFNNTHMGYANLVFKGGVIFLFFYLAVLASNLWVLLRNRSHPMRAIPIYFTLFMALQFIYSPIWGYVPTLFWVGFSVFGPEIFYVLGSQMKAHQHVRSMPSKPTRRGSRLIRM